MNEQGNLAVSIPDAELYQALEERIDEDDWWLAEELVRRYILCRFKLANASRALERQAFLIRLGESA